MMGVGYVIMYLLRGDLPWQHVQEDNKQKQKALYLESKIVNTPKVLCEGYPKEFELYFNHVMSLEFEQEPDYE